MPQAEEHKVLQGSNMLAYETGIDNERNRRTPSFDFFFKFENDATGRFAFR